LLKSSDVVFGDMSKAMQDSDTTNEQMTAVGDSLQRVIDDCSEVIRHLNDMTRKGDLSGEP
jgi:hypothetical protein